MLKIADTYDGYNQLGVTASIKNDEDAILLQKIFRSLVESCFSRELSLGLEYDEGKRKAVENVAFQYPTDTFFTIIWHNEKSKITVVDNPEKRQLISSDMWGN